MYNKKSIDFRVKSFLKTSHRKLILSFLSYKIGIIMPSLKGCSKDY